jgi:hypothetical protein
MLNVELITNNHRNGVPSNRDEPRRCGDSQPSQRRAVAIQNVPGICLFPSLRGRAKLRYPDPTAIVNECRTQHWKLLREKIFLEHRTDDAVGSGRISTGAPCPQEYGPQARFRHLHLGSRLARLTLAAAFDLDGG